MHCVMNDDTPQYTMWVAVELVVQDRYTGLNGELLCQMARVSIVKRNVKEA